MGGEYSVRGYDIRSIGPLDPSSGLMTGGNKTLLFNAEYSVNVGGPVRALGFFDAGQVQDIGQSFKRWEPVQTIEGPPTPLLIDPFAPVGLIEPGSIKVVTIGKASAFKTSMGGEVRFFMPVLNVPFRLIAAYNPSATGDNNSLPQKKFTFKFAVGTTF
jgi:outer membrane protein insertion porin family